MGVDTLDIGEVPALVWLWGWRRSARGLRLEAVVQRHGKSVTTTAPAALLMDMPRAFEPSSRPFAGVRTDSVRVQVDDLSQLSHVMRPGRLVGSQIPQAKRGRQAIFAAEFEGSVAYIPASLLLRELWLWSRPALYALFTPNVLDIYLSCSSGTDGVVVEAGGPLTRAASSDTGLRRLSWLAQCPDARASWSSVLSCAHAGAISLKLPRASLRAWGWGIKLRHGILVAELSSVSIGFELPAEGGRIQLGQRTLNCPKAQPRRTGLVSY